MKIEDSSFDLTSTMGKILKLAAEDNPFENVKNKIKIKKKNQVY